SKYYRFRCCSGIRHPRGRNYTKWSQQEITRPDQTIRRTRRPSRKRTVTSPSVSWYCVHDNAASVKLDRCTVAFPLRINENWPRQVSCVVGPMCVPWLSCGVPLLSVVSALDFRYQGSRQTRSSLCDQNRPFSSPR